MKNKTPVYLPALGIACALGVGKQAVARALFNPSPNSHNSFATLLSGKTVPVFPVPNELPALPEGLENLNSRNNRLLRIALDEIQEAISQAKVQYGASRVGVVIATSTSGMVEEEQAFAHRHLTGELPPQYHHNQVEMASPSMFAAKYLELLGPAYTVSTACSSGGKALCSARRLLNAGICDAVITGGVDTLCDLTLNGFDSLELLAENISRPFSKNRNGINIGEGAAVFLMTRESATGIEFAGGGESSDAYHISCPDPHGDGAQAAINAALAMAQLQPGDIAYINLHGTGTTLNDGMESRCINRVFGPALPCSSTKALTGHTLGASGALEAAFLWLALAEESDGSIPVPAHIWDNARDEDLSVINLTTANQRVPAIKGKFALMSTSFAFGGSNVSVILSKTHKSVADLLPHSPPMVLLDEVVAHQNDFIHTTVIITPNSPFCENGLVPAYVAIEYMAQAIGVWNGLIASQQGIAPKIGFLVGSRRLTLDTPGFKVGEKLDVYGQAKYIDGEMAAFDCWIEIQDQRVASGGLNVYQPNENL